MENKFLFNFDVKNIIMFSFLALLPNIFGIVHYTTIFGLRIHFFQYAIFLAALLYGPFGGFVSGAIGSIYVAVALNNPYIIIGNIILGVFVGFFVKLNWNVVVAVLAAYGIQLLWLVPTDIYLVHMSAGAVEMVVVSLLISNLIFGVLAKITVKKIKHYF